MNKILVALFCFTAIIALVTARPHKGKTLWHQLDNYDFEQYRVEFNKRYDSNAEYNFRQQVFQANLNKIRSHNANPTKTWKEGVNHLTDLTEEEFKVMLGYDKNIAHATKEKYSANVRRGVSVRDVADLPKSVDWRREDIVTSVKDQGHCGSCWTFAATQTIESHYARKYGPLHVLSEQNILDCVANPQQCGGTGGCSGGTAELAFDSLAQGIASEWTYPYQSYFGSNFTCRFNDTKAATPAIAKIDGFTKLEENKYLPLMEAVATLGPIAISVDASTFRNYESGVFDGCNQTNPDINHAVQLVGYGTEGGLDYWLVRNSWSPAFGEQGYIRILRTSGEETRCGLDLTPGDGTACKGDTTPKLTCGTCGILYDSCYPHIV